MIAPLLLSLLMAATALGDAPEVKIAGPAAVLTGSRMVVVNAEVVGGGVQGVKHDFDCTIFVGGERLEGFFAFERDDRMTIIFPSSDEPSLTTIVVDVDRLVGDPPRFGGDTLAVHAISVVAPPDPTPPPTPTPPGPTPPGPGPGPAPAPDFDPGRYGLERFAYESIANFTPGLAAAQRGEVAGVLASSYSSVAAKIVALPGNYDLGSARTLLRETNARALDAAGVPKDRLDQLARSINDRFAELDRTGQIRTASDLAVAAREMSRGFEKFRGAPSTPRPRISVRVYPPELTN